MSVNYRNLIIFIKSCLDSRQDFSFSKTLSVEIMLRIKEWSEDDRPREKMFRQGCSSLSNAELLAILINSGNAEESAVELSQRMLHSFNNNLNTRII